MSETEVESLVRKRIQERKASVPVPDGLGDQILRSLRTNSPVPARRLGRELLAAAALIATAAVIAGSIAWARGYWRSQPAAPAGLAHLDLNQDLHFDYPAKWRAFNYDNTSSFSSVLVYLSTQQLHDPCTRSLGVNAGGLYIRTTCDQPLDHLNSGGILVTWTTNGFPGWTIDKEKGSRTTIGGRAAVMGSDKPGECAQVGGDETITAAIQRDAPNNYYRMVACLSGSNRAATERAVNAMLQSVTIGGGTATSSPSPQPSATVLPTDISQLVMINTRIGWALDSQKVIRTVDGGAHWNAVTPAAASANGNQIAAVAFLDAYHAWIAAAPSSTPATDPSRVTLIKTSDGGASWSAAGTADIAQGGVVQLDFIDAQLGWLRADLGVAAGSSGIAIYKTVDGGSHWTLASQTSGNQGSTQGSVPLSCLKNAVTFISPIRGWVTGTCYGGGPVFYRSDDSGRTWRTQLLPAPWNRPESVIRQCQCGTAAPQFTSTIDGTLTVNAFENNGPINFLYVTHDAGTTWAARPLPVPAVGAVDFINASTGWAVSFPGIVYQTADGGGHWQRRGALFPQTPGPPVYFIAVDFLDASNGWVATRVGIHTGLLRSSDGGRTWSAPS